MIQLQQCAACGGFVPAQLAQCPHCDAGAPEQSTALAKAARACLKVATGGAVAMTLMACYGGPPHSYGQPVQSAQTCEGAQASDPSCQPAQASPPAEQPAGSYAEPPPAQSVLAR